MSPPLCADLDRSGASAGQEGGMLLEAQDLARGSGGGGWRCARTLLQGRESRSAPAPHFQLQPVPACVGEVLSIARYF